MKAHDEAAIHRWLDEAAAAMGGDAGRRGEALRELEATIHERIADLSGGREGGGELPEAAVRDVLDALGDPAEIGAAFMPMPALIESKHTRPFVLHTFIVFAIHFLLVVGATMAARPFEIPPVRLLPLADPKSLLEILARILETLVFDAGLVLCSYVAFRRLGLLLRSPRTALAVLPDRRRCLEGAVFLVLVLVVVNFFRDTLLALYLRHGDATAQVPLVGPGILDNLLLFNVWLLAAVARDVGYLWRGERRLTIGLDLFAGSLGIFCLLRMVASERLIDLGLAQEAIGPTADNLAALLNAAFTVLMLLGASALAVRLVRRLFRLTLLRA